MDWAEIKKAVNSNLAKPLNTLIDEGVSALTALLGTKSSQTSVNTLQTSVNSKASQTSVDTISSKIPTGIYTKSPQNLRWVYLGSVTGTGVTITFNLPLNVRVIFMSKDYTGYGSGLTGNVIGCVINGVSLGCDLCTVLSDGIFPSASTSRRLDAIFTSTTTATYLCSNTNVNNYYALVYDI